MIRILIAALASVLASSLATAQSTSDQAVARLDPALDALVAPDAKVELVKGGFGFTEGPVWVQKGREGYLLFTDIYGAFRLRDKDPRRELDFNAVYRWKDGKLALVVKDMPATNGLAFSPDEKYLYVNGSRDNYVNRYEVLADGTLANGKLFIDLSKETERGVTDGLRVDTQGNLYETGPGGVWIISPAG